MPEVAGRLMISPCIGLDDLCAIYSKLDVTSRTGVTRFAIEQHLI